MLAIPSRENTLEILDTGDYTQDEYEQTLAQLALINHLTNGYAPTLRAFRKLVALTPERPLRILDIGFGYGDTLRAVAKEARRLSIEVELVGVELNPAATRIAEEQTANEFSSTLIKFETCDVFSYRPEKPFHMIMNALMMHHLTDAEVVTLLKWMESNSEVCWFINDLHRHPIAFHFIKTFAPLARFNRLICNDAPLSVARSFTRSDWKRLTHEAGLSNARVEIKWHWAFRYGVMCAKRS